MNSLIRYDKKKEQKNFKISKKNSETRKKYRKENYQIICEMYFMNSLKRYEKKDVNLRILNI